MLLQSHAGEIHLLPALPKAWNTGSVSGLRARGGFEVDMAWENGQLTEARLHSTLGRDCTLRTAATVSIACDNVPIETEQLDSVVTFGTEAQKTYEIAVST